MRMNAIKIGAVVFSLCLLSCNNKMRSLVLPLGNVEKGKSAFRKLECNRCHSVGNIEWKETPGLAEIKLGGKVSQIKTYEELVTSVINPSHRISALHLPDKVMENGKSKMTIYNDVMTVQQLVDLVTFLQLEYDVETPDYQYNFPVW